MSPIELMARIWLWSWFIGAGLTVAALLFAAGVWAVGFLRRHNGARRGGAYNASHREDTQ